MKGSRYKLDLHTHSIISHDGGISATQYEKILNSGELDIIAITDHNEISFARIMQKKLGDRIIVGEEISTKEGEIIGLYLKETIPGGISVDEAVSSIKQQGGYVYIPHPFETFRHGWRYESLQRIVSDIDIVETFNGRGRIRGKPLLAEKFARHYALVEAASSDAHGWKGLGHTASLLSEFPTQKKLKQLLSNALLDKTYAPFFTIFYPFLNKIKNNVVLFGEH